MFMEHCMCIYFGSGEISNISKSVIVAEGSKLSDNCDS